MLGYCNLLCLGYEMGVVVVVAGKVRSVVSDGSFLDTSERWCVSPMTVVRGVQDSILHTEGCNGGVNRFESSVECSSIPEILVNCRWC